MNERTSGLSTLRPFIFVLMVKLPYKLNKCNAMDVGCAINNFRIQISSRVQPASTLMFKQSNPGPKRHVKGNITGDMEGMSSGQCKRLCQGELD